jgi:sulfite exporter TauE/SafE
LTAEVLLYFTAASIGALHTILGPDHYLPFIFMSQAGKWSKIKTFWVTILCGIGHIGSSVLLGLIGIAFGITLHKLVTIESIRGNIAAWLFISFGFVYMIYGIKKAIKNKKHSHIHFHSEGIAHIHTHHHIEEHSHVHSTPQRKNITPWILFTIFVFGPCEPLIPLLMFPAAQNSQLSVIIVCLVFGLTTIATMTTIVMLSLWGIRSIKIDYLERYMTAIAGATIFICGLAIQFLGL